MQIEAGVFYRSRDGRRVGPMVWKPQPSWSQKGYWDGIIEPNESGNAYFPGVYPNGRGDPDGVIEYGHDLIAPWHTDDQTDVIIPTMSPEEALQELHVTEAELDAAAAKHEPPIRVQILHAGAALTNGQRDQEYGPPRVNMAAAGALKKAFRDHLTRDIDPAELEAIDMVLTKLGRIATGTPKLDTYVDGSTYFAIAGEIAMTPTTQTEAYSATDL